MSIHPKQRTSTRPKKRYRPAETAGLGQTLVAEASDPMTGAVLKKISLISLPDLDGGTLAPPDCFGLTLDGDCMSPLLFSGDVVFMRKDRPPRPGRPAAIKLRGYKPTIKVWMPQGDGVRLVPVNKEYSPIRTRTSEIEWAFEVLLAVRFRAESGQAAGGDRRPDCPRARGRLAVTAGCLAAERGKE